MSRVPCRSFLLAATVAAFGLAAPPATQAASGKCAKFQQMYTRAVKSGDKLYANRIKMRAAAQGCRVH